MFVKLHIKNTKYFLVRFKIAVAVGVSAGSQRNIQKNLKYGKMLKYNVFSSLVTKKGGEEVRSLCHVEVLYRCMVIK